MADKIYRYEVKMTCSGCSGAVERALKRVDDISADVNLDSQMVEVTAKDGKVSADHVLEKIQKTGKKVLKMDRGDGQGLQEIAVAA